MTVWSRHRQIYIRSILGMLPAAHTAFKSTLTMQTETKNPNFVAVLVIVLPQVTQLTRFIVDLIVIVISTVQRM